MLRGLSIPRLGIPGWAGSRSCACTNGWAMGAGAARGLLLLIQLLLPCLAIVSALGCGKRGSLGQRWRGWGKTQRLRKGLGAEMGFGQTGLGYEGGTHVAGEKQSPGER